MRSQCLIDGMWIGVAEEAIFDPATGLEIGKVPNLDAKAAHDAIAAANAALPNWRAKTAHERSAVLRKWFDLIMANQEDLAHILTAEQGKPLAEARGEIAYAASFIEFYAEEAKRIYGETLPSPKADARILVLRQPLGVVAAITPWNFPAAMIARKVGPALAVGCTMVLKPAPETPFTALALAELGQRAGITAGVFNVVTGDAKAIGEVWCASEIVRGLSFTGSTPIGKLLMRQCADTVKKLGLELGGNAPFLVFDDADLDAAVEGAIASKFRNMGQTCVCANRLYVQAGIHDAFVERLTQKVAQMKLGPGTQTGVTQGPLINKAALAKVESHVADALEKGAKLVIGGKVGALGGTFFEPTVITGVTAAMKFAQEETFGPVAPIFVFKEEADALAQANDTPFGLQAYVYTKDLARTFRVAEALEAGIIGVNSGITSSVGVPFGGIKQSGLGREGSHHGVEEYLELKYVYLGGLS
ncbi:NAD-dependent succinate-semialdehyde dehydrogenase [Candidatus Phycosocius spiralis]|nr:NAD-dependent succinate-semialdehyde dehydrogenase [Candidatus Phycosocius spiralis]